MGVPVGEAEGGHPALLECGECGARYETDETMGNDCPECGTHRGFDVIDGGDPDGWRPDGEPL